MNNTLVAQFSKFVVVGFINTAIDFGVLNALSFLTGIYSGSYLIILNSTAFIAAVTNSYLMNKYWTFATRGGGGIEEVSKFLTVSLIGLFINTSLVFLITTHFSPLFGLGPALWENFAKAVATGASLIWNFIGYKFIVFKRK